jgi:hypothetical protein
MLLSKLIEPDRTRSDLERDFVALCERAGIPPPGSTSSSPASRSTLSGWTHG